MRLQHIGIRGEDGGRLANGGRHILSLVYRNAVASGEGLPSKKKKKIRPEFDLMPGPWHPSGATSVVVPNARNRFKLTYSSRAWVVRTS